MTAVDVLVTDQVDTDITEMWTKLYGQLKRSQPDVPDDKMFAFLDRNVVGGRRQGCVDKVVCVECKERDGVSSDVEAAEWRIVGFTNCAELRPIAAPVLNDKMIVIKEPYTSLIMDGTKTMELRHCAIQGEYFLADSTTHTVKAKLFFGGSRELSQEDYENTRLLHRDENPTKRYKKTVGTWITSVRPLAEEPSYKAKKGSIGFAKFQPAAV